jgi:hypothetical protein
MSFVPVRKTGAFSDVWPPEGYTLFWFSARYGRVINMSPPLQTDFRASRAWQMVFPLVGAFAQPMGIILLYFAKKGTSLDIIGFAQNQRPIRYKGFTAYNISKFGMTMV